MSTINIGLLYVCRQTQCQPLFGRWLSCCCLKMHTTRIKSCVNSDLGRVSHPQWKQGSRAPSRLRYGSRGVMTQVNQTAGLNPKYTCLLTAAISNILPFRVQAFGAWHVTLTPETPRALAHQDQLLCMRAVSYCKPSCMHACMHACHINRPYKDAQNRLLW